MPQSHPSYKSGFARSQAESSNPHLRDGLRGLWMPTMGATGGKLFDLSGNRKHGTIIDGVNSDVRWSNTQDGPAVEIYNCSYGSSSRISCGYFDLPEGSLTMRFKSPTVGYDAYAGLACIDSGFWIKAGLLTYAYITDSADVAVHGTSVALNTGKHVTITFAWEGSTWYWYTDGDYIATRSGSNPIFGSGDFYLFSRSNLARSWEGELSYAALHDRILQPAEIQHLANDPYAIVRPCERRVYSIPSASSFNPWWATTRQQTIGGGIF